MMIDDVQGSGTASPRSGQVNVEGIVVGDSQNTPAEFGATRRSTASPPSPPTSSV